MKIHILNAPHHGAKGITFIDLCDDDGSTTSITLTKPEVAQLISALAEVSNGLAEKVSFGIENESY